MTEDHDFKAIVRARMARTGESYMEARRQLQSTTPEEAPAGPEQGAKPMQFERFTDRARRALVVAQEEARAFGDGFLGTEHLALGLVADDAGIAGRVLTTAGLTTERLRDAIVAARASAGSDSEGDDGAETKPPPFTGDAKKILEFALREALRLGHNWIGTEHLLLALLRDDAEPTARIITELGGPIDELRDRTLAFVKLMVTASALPVHADNARLMAAIRCLPDAFRTEAEAARKATVGAALAEAQRRTLDLPPDASLEELQVHYEDVPAALEAARAALADLGVLRVLDIVQELQATEEWEAVRDAERSTGGLTPEVMQAGPEERVAAFVRARELREAASLVVAAAWAEIYERHERESLSELRAVLAEAAARIAAIGQKK